MPKTSTLKSAADRNIRSLENHLLKAKAYKEYTNVLKARTLAGQLIDKETVEHEFNVFVGSLRYSLDDSVRQIVNLTTVGKSREVKIELHKKITSLVIGALTTAESKVKLETLDVDPSDTRTIKRAQRRNRKRSGA